jgi:hypothetical protein
MLFVPIYPLTQFVFYPCTSEVLPESPEWIVTSG